MPKTKQERRREAIERAIDYANTNKDLKGKSKEEKKKYLCSFGPKQEVEFLLENSKKKI